MVKTIVLWKDQCSLTMVHHMITDSSLGFTEFINHQITHCLILWVSRNVLVSIVPIVHCYFLFHFIITEAIQGIIPYPKILCIPYSNIKSIGMVQTWYDPALWVHFLIFNFNTVSISFVILTEFYHLVLAVHHSIRMDTIHSGVWDSQYSCLRDFMVLFILGAMEEPLSKFAFENWSYNYD